MTCHFLGREEQNILMFCAFSKNIKSQESLIELLTIWSLLNLKLFIPGKSAKRKGLRSKFATKQNEIVNTFVFPIQLGPGNDNINESFYVKKPFFYFWVDYISTFILKLSFFGARFLVANTKFAQKKSRLHGLPDSEPTGQAVNSKTKISTT